MTSTSVDPLALKEQGRYAEAEAALRERLFANPADRAARSELLHILLLQGLAPPAQGVSRTVAVARALAGMRGAPALGGADEGARLDQAYGMIRSVLHDLPDALKPRAAQILRRAGDYARADALGDLAELGRIAVHSGDVAFLLHQMSQVKTDADRREVLAQHRLWASGLEAAARANPLPQTAPAKDRPRFRVGFLSSDLRNHVVAYFAQPLFQFRDPRFDLYVYDSHPGEPDSLMGWFVSRVSAWRPLPPDDRDAAAIIADDDLDLLIDLGGPTSGNRPGVLAYKPAPQQATWLGYPHSLGLSAMDHFLCDEVLVPPEDDLLPEIPQNIPGGWICMAPAAFPDDPALEPVSPAERNGYVTFGTANDPYKFGPAVIRAWAAVLQAVPDSRFLMLRPEAGAQCFRANISALFAEAGIGPERLDFRPIRGGVRPLYAEMDIALDTFPITGGTTTCEALWMGVPTVTRLGPAVYERLSGSILRHVGLDHLCADNIDDYVRIAVDLANRPAPGLSEFRRSLRSQAQASPMGDPARFSSAFYNLLGQLLA